jgi:hypothetical protein
MSPLSNAFVKAEELFRPEMFYPLRTFVCDRCWLVQLPEIELAQNIFREDYAYFSAYSESWLRHCETYAQAMTERFGLGRSSLVVEVASNDGYLLQYFHRDGVPVLGVEPSKSVASAAIQKGIPTEVRFFGVETARTLVDRGRRADVMVANNVLAHVPNLHDFVAGFVELLAERGVVTFEFPHLAQLIAHVEFDTIYQEHYSYLSLHVVKRILLEHRLVVFDVDELSTHGGSLRVYARHERDGTKPVHARVGALLLQEAKVGLTSHQAYVGFREKVDRVKRDLVDFLIHTKNAGKRVVAYGAPAKGNTLLNYCGIRTDLLEFTVDRNPYKQGLFLPGVHIPVFAPERLEEAKPDFVLVLPWNLRTELTAQLAHVRAWGGRLVFAIPKLEIVE